MNWLLIIILCLSFSNAYLFDIYMKEDWKPIFAVSCHFTLDVLYSESGYKLFFAECSVIAGWHEKNYKKNLFRLNLRTNYWIPIFVALPNFSLDVLYGGGSKIHYYRTLHIGQCNKGKVKKEVWNTFLYQI